MDLNAAWNTMKAMAGDAWLQAPTWWRRWRPLHRIFALCCLPAACCVDLYGMTSLFGAGAIRRNAVAVSKGLTAAFLMSVFIRGWQGPARTVASASVLVQNSTLKNNITKNTIPYVVVHLGPDTDMTQNIHNAAVVLRVSFDLVRNLIRLVLGTMGEWPGFFLICFLACHWVK